MKENLFTPDCIRTFSGNYINVTNPDIDLICIEDIAHSLSMQCRFGGHLPKFYSVAQHCIHVSERMSTPIDMLCGLMHDASEAYLMDIPSPIKKQILNYNVVENGLMYTIAEKFGFKYPLPDCVHKADKEMLQIEWDCLMINKYKSIIPVNSEQVEIDFINRFNLINQFIKFQKKPIL